MPTLHQFDYIFAIGTVFCTLDAFMIGANDVANAFATSVSSKSLTLRQACLCAAVFEFLGAVTVGARTASTIKNGIVAATVFNGNAGLQMLAFTNAIFVSAVWLSIATFFSWPVSTTYSIVSAVAGSGIAAGGFSAPAWGWNGGSGLGAIWAGLVIAPSMAAAFGAIVYLLVKFIVLRSSKPTKMGLYTGPVWFFLVACVCTMSIIYKGSPTLKLNEMSQGKTAAAIVLTGLVISILACLFWVPYVHAVVIKKDHTLRWYHFLMGPLLFRRPAPVDAGEHAYVKDYRIRANVEGDILGDTISTQLPAATSSTAESQINDPTHLATEKDKETSGSDSSVAGHGEIALAGLDSPPRATGPLGFFRMVGKSIWKVISHGSSVDIHALQAGAKDTPEGKRMQDIYNRAKQYPNETEHLFSFLQVLTACTASFAHGANDLSNAIGPFSVIYYTWSSGLIAGRSVPVEVWMLVFGASALVLGLATYGYNIMAVLGNRITLHSPSRGFTMELGAAITVILASQYGIPVSTTMCITGATIGVSLCNGDVRSTNWRALAWIYFGWICTIIIVMTMSACSLAIIINAPRR